MKLSELIKRLTSIQNKLGEKDPEVFMSVEVDGYKQQMVAPKSVRFEHMITPETDVQKVVLDESL